MRELKERIIEIDLEIDGIISKYKAEPGKLGLAITAQGKKSANAIQNECTVSITNLEKSKLNRILTLTSPYNEIKTPKTVTVKAGREGQGVQTLFVGDVVTSSVSQPPDIRVELKCATKNFQKGTLVSKSQPALANLSDIGGSVAQDLGLIFNFQAAEKQISNYVYSGSELNQVDDLNNLGEIDCYVDDDQLVIKNKNQPLQNQIVLINAATGMIGTPTLTEQGIKVKFLVQNIVTVGTLLRVESKIYPAVNGDYSIYELGFNIANRDIPFYYIASGKRL